MMIREAEYCFEHISVKDEITLVTNTLFEQVFRTDFNKPGFSLLTLDKHINSINLREIMLSIKDEFDKIYLSKFGKPLYYLTIGRYDQKESTKFHLDGAPEESFLIIGYEQSDFVSELEIADYSKAAYDLGISPKQFLDEYNPIFASGEQLLQPYITKIKCYDKNNAQILIVNNSCLEFSQSKSNQLGVLHKAIMLDKNNKSSRVINSMLISPTINPTEEINNQDIKQSFLNMSVITRKPYEL